MNEELLVMKELQTEEETPFIQKPSRGLSSVKKFKAMKRV
jgi:hypothetical protein